MSEAVGDALIALVEWSWPRLGPKLGDIVDRVADAVRPDPPISLVTLDGDVLTGVVVLDRGEGIAFLGTRQPAPPGLGRAAFHPHDQPLWPREVDPYRR